MLLDYTLQIISTGGVVRLGSIKAMCLKQVITLADALGNSAISINSALPTEYSHSSLSHTFYQSYIPAVPQHILLSKSLNF